MSYLAFVFIAIIAMASSLSTCSSSPQVSGVEETCWKPLAVDTFVWPDSITNPGNSPTFAQDRPVWSTSGELVAYYSWFDSCNNPDRGIYIADSSGGSSRRKIPVLGTYFQWLPGDTQLIISGVFGHGLVLYNINTDSVTPLGIQNRSTLFDVSLNGRYIYYHGEPVPPHQGASIFEYDRETGTEWAVAQGVAPTVSPNRLMLAYWDGAVRIFTFQDSSTITLPNGGGSEWLPDERTLVSEDGLGKIFVIDISGNVRLLTGGPGLSGAYGPISVSPNGKRVLYEQVSNDFAMHIWEISIDGGDAKQFSK